MGDHNSLGVYTQILERLVTDIATDWCYINSVELKRELMKMRSRARKEGFSFFTKTLPSYGKAFDKALQGNDAFTPVGFRKKPGRTTPLFLWWLIERVFDDQGHVLELVVGSPRCEEAITAVRHVRQITQLLYKLELPSNETSTKKVLDSFVAVNLELQKLEIDPRDAIIKRARSLITEVLGGLSSRDIIPGHGPGAVATGEVGGEKSSFSRMYKDSEAWYPFTEYFHVSLSHTCDRLHQLPSLEELVTGTAKVVLVPKDSRGPRLISCEPLEKQWLQQGQRKALYSHIERHPLTRQRVNFARQDINRRLALESSLTQELVTLDMKEASDRVSLKLVSALFCGTEWYHALLATRSGSTRLPDGTRVDLETFAPMGSSVCFPVEALVFWALASSAIHTRRGGSLYKACRSVYVYGDDIICNREDYPVVMQQLERFGLLFNRSKCCVSGFFRESCGCDAFMGVDVTPIRLRKTWCQRSPHDPLQLQSYVEFSNSMYKAGYSRVASFVERLVRGLYKVPIPYVRYQELPDWEYDLKDHTLKKLRNPTKGTTAPPGRVIGFDRPDVNHVVRNRETGVRMRFNRYAHQLEAYGYAITPRTEVWEEDGWERLLRTLTCGATGLQAGEYALPHASRIKRTWGVIG